MSCPAALLSPSFFAALLLFHLSLNSFFACILRFSMFYPGLFLSRSSLSFSLFFFPSCSTARARPPILLTNARNPSAPLGSSQSSSFPPLFSRQGAEGSRGSSLSLLFFPSLVLTHTLSPPLSAFIGLRCSGAAIAASGSLTFTSGDKYGFVWDIPGFQRRQVFDTDPPSCDLPRSRFTRGTPTCRNARAARLINRFGVIELAARFSFMNFHLRTDFARLQIF